jgi:hypothetical protein
MRKLLIAACALAIAAPAAAQSQNSRADDYRAEGYRDGEFEEALPDRRDIARTGEVLDRLLGAMLNLPIGPIVTAVDPQGRGRYRPSDTLRDLSDDPHVEERLRGSIRSTTAGIGAMTEAMAAMAPVLRQTIHEARRRMEDAMSAPHRD